MREETDALHERYYKKFAKLQSNSTGGLIPVDVQKEIAANLLDEYRTEYAQMKASDEVEIARAEYRQQLRARALKPKPRKRFLWIFHRRANAAAIQIERETQAEIEEYFATCNGAIEHADDADEVGGRPEPTAEQADEQVGQADQTTEHADEDTPEEQQAKPKGKKRKPQPDNAAMPGQMSIAELGNDQAEQSDAATATADLSFISKKD